MTTLKSTRPLCGWGLYPCAEAEILEDIDFSKSFIPRAYGKSYGDEALYERVYDVTNLNLFLDFQEDTIEVQAGISLDKIIKFLLPKGFSLPIVPGTALISVGGAISNDIHGKSSKGAFGDFVESFEIITPNGVYTCSRKNNDELFWGAIGGMGLLGVITKAKLKIVKASPYISQLIIKTNGVGKAINILKEHDTDFEFSVVWIDAFTENSIIMFGDYLYYEDLPVDLKLSFGILKEKNIVDIPFLMPDFLINDIDMRAYNMYYFLKMPEDKSIINYFDFFFPLDNIRNWNRLYGKRGFVQYQFVGSEDAVLKIFDIIKREKIYPYLVVLKRLKSAKNRVFSFVKEGFTLAMDFPINSKVFNMLKDFDKIVIDCKGHIYMAKDARISKDVFSDIYKDSIKTIMSLKAKYDKDLKLKSMMFERLFL